MNEKGPGLSGLFIVLEGLDGCGKTTQAEKLAVHLKSQGVEVLELKEPGGTAHGEQVRNWFLNSEESMRPLTEAFLIEASRHELVEAVIRPALGRNVTVICQRYVYSTLAYQGYGRGLELSVLNALNDFATDGLLPDVGIVIDVPAEEAWERLNSVRTLDRLEQAGLQFLKAVESGYHELVEKFPELIIVDGTKDEDSVFNEIAASVERIEGGRNGF